jgi:hypothetical protein
MATCAFSIVGSSEYTHAARTDAGRSVSSRAALQETLAPRTPEHELDLTLQGAASHYAPVPMPFQSSRPLPRALWRAERAEVRQGVATRGTVSAIAFTRTALRPPETVLRARRSAAVGPALEPETGAEACSSIQPPGGSSSGNPGELDPCVKGQLLLRTRTPSPAG